MHIEKQNDHKEVQKAQKETKTKNDHKNTQDDHIGVQNNYQEIENDDKEKLNNHNYTQMITKNYYHRKMQLFCISVSLGVVGWVGVFCMSVSRSKGVGLVSFFASFYEVNVFNAVKI